MDSHATLSIPADDEGYIALECPYCRNDFKIRASDLDGFEGADLFCTSCGLSNERAVFLMTPKVKTAAHVIAHNVGVDLVNQMTEHFEARFRGSKFLKVTATPQPKAEVPRLRAIADLAEAEVPCCETMVKLPFDQAMSLFYCPFCGNAQS